MKETSGLFLLHKKPGLSSFGALKSIKERYPDVKVGHCGTLDPFAEGLLLVLLGSSTVFSSFLMNFSKLYWAEIVFGRETDSLDCTGEVVREAPIPSAEVLYRAFGSLQGTVQQSPPKLSAIHVKGKRAWKLFHEGVDFSLPPREVHIEPRWNAYRNGVLTVDLFVSKGTYIRSYARDLGALCGSAAFVKTLCRRSIGPFLLSDAKEEPNDGDLIPPHMFVTKLLLEQCLLTERGEENIQGGRSLEENHFKESPPPSQIFIAQNRNRHPLALIRRQKKIFRYSRL